MRFNPCPGSAHLLRYGRLPLLITLRAAQPRREIEPPAHPGRAELSSWESAAAVIGRLWVTVASTTDSLIGSDLMMLIVMPENTVVDRAFGTVSSRHAAQLH